MRLVKNKLTMRTRLWPRRSLKRPMAAAEMEAVAPVTASSRPVVEATFVFRFPTSSMNSGIIGMAILIEKLNRRKTAIRETNPGRCKERPHAPALFQCCGGRADKFLLCPRQTRRPPTNRIAASCNEGQAIAGDIGNHAADPGPQRTSPEKPRPASAPARTPVAFPGKMEETREMEAAMVPVKAPEIRRQTRSW